MKIWPELIASLKDEQIQELMKFGETIHLEEGSNLFSEGDVLDSLYWLIDGLLGVRLEAAHDENIRLFGPDALITDSAVLLPSIASSSVIAIEDSRLIRFSAQRLAECFAKSPELEAVFYRSLAMLNVRECRLMLEHMGSNEIAGFHHSTEHLEHLVQMNEMQQMLRAFKATCVDVDRLSRQEQETPANLIEQLREQFNGINASLIQAASAESSLPPLFRQEIGSIAQQEMLPYLLMTDCAARMYTKPRGYAGDYYTIEKIYQDVEGGTGEVGRLIDRFFLDQPAAVAVKNRRHLMATEIKRTMQDKGDRAVRVMSLACGPAREIFDTYETLDEPGQLLTTLLDVDVKALSFVSDGIANRKLGKYIRLVPENLIYLALGKRDFSIEPQDFIYSIGLIDYFSDDLVVKVLDFIFSLLRPGGRVMLGNFHPRNPSKPIMDHVLEWELHHRDEEGMHRLFKESRFASGANRIIYEEQGVNLFAECVRGD